MSHLRGTSVKNNLCRHHVGAHVRRSCGSARTKTNPLSQSQRSLFSKPRPSPQSPSAPCATVSFERVWGKTHTHRAVKELQTCLRSRLKLQGRPGKEQQSPGSLQDRPRRRRRPAGAFWQAKVGTVLQDLLLWIYWVTGAGRYNRIDLRKTQHFHVATAINYTGLLQSTFICIWLNILP